MDKEEKKLIKGFCDRKCEYYQEETMPSYTKVPPIDILELCSYGGNRRSFGCMNCCPNPEKK